MMSKKESGFTLIEIVMVLVLLGILMAVAAPKYFDLQKEAQVQAANAVAAELQARVNGEFAKGLLEGDTCSVARGAAVVSVRAGGNNEIKSDQWTVSDLPNPTGSTTTVSITWKDSNEVVLTPTIYLPECLP